LFWGDMEGGELKGGFNATKRREKPEKKFMKRNQKAVSNNHKSLQRYC